MSRWEPNARERLQAAALELFSERGFEGTTVAEIAERAGLTERTFFRHFADKREVMFFGSQALQERVVRAIEEAPARLGALEAIRVALDAFGEAIPDRVDYARRRYAIIEANPELHERERNKLAALGEAMAAALRARGVKESTAHLASEMANAVFRIAFRRWLTEPGDRKLRDYMRESLDELQAVAATPAAAARDADRPPTRAPRR